MKKRIKFLIPIFLVCILSLFFVACGKETLMTPSAVTLDVENNLTWAEVDGAIGYSVEIKSVETEQVTINDTRRCRLSLSKLEEGDYEIRVKAMGDAESYEDSAWTEIGRAHV